MYPFSYQLVVHPESQLPIQEQSHDPTPKKPIFVWPSDNSNNNILGEIDFIPTQPDVNQPLPLQHPTQLLSHELKQVPSQLEKHGWPA